MRFSAIVAGLVALAAHSASAADIQVTRTFDTTRVPCDATLCYANGYLTPAAIPDQATVTVAEGDTFDLTVDFLGSQSLTIGYPVEIGLRFITPNGIAATATTIAQVSLLGADGTALLTSNVKQSALSAAALGATFGFDDFTNPPANLTFYGIRLVATLLDYDTIGLTSRDYPYLVVALQSAVDPVPGVPEPATWAMMLVGFGAVGLRHRAKHGYRSGASLLS